MEINEEVINIIKAGGVGVIPTDTIYGIVGSASNEDAINRIHQIKNRPTDKKMIVLIGNRGQLPALGIIPNDKEIQALNEFWPGPVSIILSTDGSMPFLHADDNTLGVRLPAETWLRQLINQTGPIVATSANVAGEPTPRDIELIKQQLPGLDFYVEGPTNSEPSRLGKIDKNGDVFWLRGMS